MTLAMPLDQQDPMYGPAAASETRCGITLPRSRWQEADAHVLEHGTEGDYAALWAAEALGHVSDEEVAQAIARDRKLEMYGAHQLQSMQYSQQLQSAVPLEQLEQALVLPLDVNSAGRMILLVADPSTPLAQLVVNDLSGYKLTQVVVTRSFLVEAFKHMWAASGGAHIELDRALQEVSGLGRLRDANDHDKARNQSAIIQWVDAILERAVEENASDIHFDAHPTGVKIRMRRDGRLVPLDAMDEMLTGDPSRAVALCRALVGRIFALAGAPLEQAMHRPVDARFPWKSASGRLIDVRMNAAGTAAGKDTVGITLRLLQTTEGGETLDNRGFEPRMLAWIRQALRSSTGFVAATGPTGSGKSTTLYAMLRDVQSDDISIVTVENPVERRIPGVRQLEVRESVHGQEASKMTYPSLLRALLRMDPNVILCGEIRDSESAHVALQASNTGHLLLTTLHTNTALLSVSRLRDLGVSDFAVANECRLLIAQRLVRQLCRHCAVPADANARQALARTLEVFGYHARTSWLALGLDEADLAESLDMLPGYRRQDTDYTAPPPLDAPIAEWAGLRVPRGCSQCRSTGFRDRLGVYSVVCFTEALRNAALEHAAYPELARVAFGDGSRSLLANGMLRAMRGMTSVDEVLQAVGAGISPASL